MGDRDEKMLDLIDRLDRLTDDELEAVSVYLDAQLKTTRYMWADGEFRAVQ